MIKPSRLLRRAREINSLLLVCFIVCSPSATIFRRDRNRGSSCSGSFRNSNIKAWNCSGCTVVFSSFCLRGCCRDSELSSCYIICAALDRIISQVCGSGCCIRSSCVCLVCSSSSLCKLRCEDRNGDGHQNTLEAYIRDLLCTITRACPSLVMTLDYCAE